MDKPLKKLLITGGSGFLGYHVALLATSRWQVYVMYYRNTPLVTGTIPVHCDITRYIDLGNTLEEVQPDAVLHTAALADANYCQLHPDESFEVNVEATRNLAGICSDLNIPFAFTSTDLVFDGKRGNYTEEDTPNPLMWYGAHKVQAEEDAMRIYPRTVIFRLPMMFGLREASGKNFMWQIINRLKEGKPQRLFTDEYRSVSGALSISRGILQLLENTSGIFHVAGAGKLSRYEFGLMVADVFRLEKSYLEPCRQADVPMPAPRPADVSLDIRKARSAGYEPVPVNEELTAIAKSENLQNLIAKFAP
ncbi:MAG: NAD(P)-dependent oxidoreductase [Chitinophagales bacterium]|nr:NAD(P)-dependent oxidoreductase [Chitinophagales bacterium]MDW8419331.1 NAD(P)-dependent oxidoreductase [Chitinophagales bacterium]